MTENNTELLDGAILYADEVEATARVIKEINLDDVVSHEIAKKAGHIGKVLTAYDVHVEASQSDNYWGTAANEYTKISISSLTGFAVTGFVAPIVVPFAPLVGLAAADVIRRVLSQKILSFVKTVLILAA